MYIPHDAIRTERREGNKGKGRLLSTGIYNVILLRRFLCETGVRPLIPSRSGAHPILLPYTQPSPP